MSLWEMISHRNNNPDQNAAVKRRSMKYKMDHNNYKKAVELSSLCDHIK